MQTEPITDESLASGMGRRRVARLFTEVFRMPVEPGQAAWVQVDLGADTAIDSVELLPFIVWWTGESQGFPARFRVEVSDDADGPWRSIADNTGEDYPDPGDLVVRLPANGAGGRYLRLVAALARQGQLALTKLLATSGGVDVAQGCRVTCSSDLATGLEELVRPPRPQGEYVVTDNPCNVIPPDSWKPVADQATTPLGGVALRGGLFKRAFDNNVWYLLESSTVDEMERHFLRRAGLPSAALFGHRSRQWFDTLPGSEAGRFLMGAGNALRWIDHPALRERLDRIVGTIDRCKELDGFLMGYPREETFRGEYGAYVRSWVTHGLVDAGYAGNRKAFALLRGYYDWFNRSCYLPELLRRTGQGTQGIIPSARTYFSPVGCPEDIATIQRHFQENYWMEQLADRDPDAIYRYPYDRPHNYLLTGIEPYLDLYRATGHRPYLDAVLGGWDLYRRHWQHVGGSIAISEGTDLYPPGSCFLRRGTGELCGSVFWVKLNQRLHNLYPDREVYVSEIEKSIYNVGIANQVGATGIRYHARLVDHKDEDREPYFHSMNTCCEGQGTRLLGSLPEYIYSPLPGGVMVNLFVASAIDLGRHGIPACLETATRFPYEPSVLIAVHASKPTPFTLHVRVPGWATTPMQVRVNGVPAATGEPGSYVALDRAWADGDRVTFELPVGFRLTRYGGIEPGYGDGRHFALEYGPLLMACLGDGERVLADPSDLPGALHAVPGGALRFEVEGCPSAIFAPYVDLQDEAFTCFPEVGP